MLKMEQIKKLSEFRKEAIFFFKEQDKELIRLKNIRKQLKKELKAKI